MILNLSFHPNLFNELIAIAMFNCFDELHFANSYLLLANIKLVHKHLDITPKYFVRSLNFAAGHLMNELYKQVYKYTNTCMRFT